MKKIVFGMLAHVDAGKTTMSEALLYKTGAIRHPGRVDTRDSFLDNNSMERARGITIFSKQALFSVNNTVFTLMDTPGHVDFSAETERTLSVLDYAVLVISAQNGIQAHTKTLWKLLSRYHIPVFIFVNKMDMPGADRKLILEQLKNGLSGSVIDFSNINSEETALCDEELLEEYIETGSINQSKLPLLIKNRKVFPCFFGSALKLTGIEQFIEGLSEYTLSPDYPDEFGARVYKIGRDEQGNRLTFLKVTGGKLVSKMLLGNSADSEKVNQIRIYSGEKFTSVSEADAGTVCAVTGINNSTPGSGYGFDAGSLLPLLEPILVYKLKLMDGSDPLTLLPKLRQLEEENPELQIVWNEILGEIQLQVMGPVQIEILKNIISTRFGAEVEFGSGNIVYKETIRNKVEGVGHFEPLRHYAEVHLILEPAEPGSGTEITTDCSEDSLDKNWQRLILTHLAEKNHTGVLTNSPLTDIKITLVSGRAHKKHTEGGDFRQATYRAVRNGLMQAESVLLEPFYTYTLTLPQSCIGRAMTDFERMNGSCIIQSTGEPSVLTGRAPVRMLNDYQTEILAYTRGQGKLSCQPDGYGECSDADKIIEKTGYNPEKDTLNSSDSVFCSHGSGFIVPWYEVKKYMHLEPVLTCNNQDKNQGNDENDLVIGKDKCSNHNAETEIDISLGTDEIDAIINRTAYSNSHNNGGKWKHTSGHKVLENDYSGLSKSFYQDKSRKKIDSYLLVDGYNVIFAWEELADMAKTNLDAARGMLLDRLCNYQALKHTNTIVVFDAYRVQGHDTEISDYHNIHVVFTKEAETADQYIEKFAHEHGKKYNITVATSDGLEQIIILGQGCTLISAREFEKEIRMMEEEFREEYLNRTY
ncbi:MAG: NYN domain-containing protein [Lachnospiraceae bacterium]